MELLEKLERKQRLQLFAEWNYLQNWKESKDCNYLMNGRKKESKNHIYLDTSPTMMPKSDELQYCSKDLVTPRATKFTSSTRVRTNLEVTMLYTQQMQWYTLVTFQLG